MKVNIPVIVMDCVGMEALTDLYRNSRRHIPSLKLTFSHLKMDGWNTILSYWVSAYFQGRLLLVSGRVLHSITLWQTYIAMEYPHF